MPAKEILETKQPNDIEANNLSKESAVVRTVRMLLNLMTNMLIVLTVFVSVLYAWTSSKLNAFQLHIVLCVLGYQLFMTQGTLVLSKYNSWSVHLPRQYQRHLHWLFQLMGVILVIAGSVIMMQAKHTNFETCHGIFGLCALITSLLGLVNGLLAMNAYKLRSCINVYWIKCIHQVTGAATLLLSAVCLCLGFDKIAFKSWSGPRDALILIILTCIFTMLTTIDFWINSGRRFRC